MPSSLRFAILADDLHPCPYLAGATARLPLRLPLGALEPADFDALLAAGDRRAGTLLYRPTCPTCRACEPLRLPTTGLIPTDSQRRVAKRNRDLVVEVGPAKADEERVRLYNRHKAERALDHGEGPITIDEYRAHYVESCVDTREVRYLAGDRLVGLSILDVGARAASSVYHCFDPDESRRSIGVFSVLREVELCRELGLEWYYLGLWVERCRSLTYKASFRPHERLVQGHWVRFS